MGAYQTYIQSLPVQPKVWFKFDSITGNVLTNSGTIANNLAFSSTSGWTNPTGGKDGNYLNLTSSPIYSDDQTIVPAYLNFTMAWWWRRSTVGTGNGPFTWAGATNTYTSTNGSSNSVESDGKFYFYARMGGAIGGELGPSPAFCDNQWHHFVITRNGTNARMFFDGSPVNAGNPDYGTSFINDLVGSFRFLTTGNQLDEYTLFDYAMTPAQVQALYLHQPPSININFTTTPATASSLMTAETVSTTKNVNYQPSSIITTALMTEPTIVIVDNDNTEVVTSILVNAEFPNATATAQINISNAANLLEVTAEMPEHFAIGGQNFDYFAEEASASAQFNEPTQFGSGDAIHLASPMIATNSTFNNPLIFVTPNYFNLVKKHNPAIYINGGLTNYGYAQPSTVQVQSTFVRAVDNAPMSYIYYDGSNNSYKYNNFINGNEEVNVTGAAVTTAMNNIHLTRNWTYEFWFKPNFTSIISWADSDSQTEILFSSTVLTVSHDYFDINLDSPYLPLRVQINDGSVDPFITFNVPFTLLPTQNWHHFAITAQPNPENVAQIRLSLYINGVVRAIKNTTYTPTTPASATKFAFYPAQGEVPGLLSFDEAALYPKTLTDSDILDHYNFIENYDPSKIFYTIPATASGEFINPVFFAVQNVNYPETPVTASSVFVNPVVVASQNISNSAPALLATSLAVEPFFYGNPDALIAEPSMIATADIPQNVYRLDTAYYSYVQTNIAPFRYVTFDVPNSNVDWGSDNDFALAQPFVYDGTISQAIDGLNNNSLLSTGTDYTTSGLIMKESEWDDDWGTAAGNYHSSYWIKRHPDDVGTNGLRIIQSAYSPVDGSYGILYQYQNKLWIDVFNGTSYYSESTAINVNVFDYSKHHIVVNFRKTGANHFIDIYVDKQLVMAKDVGTLSLIFKNSNSFLPPNTETNNLPRMSVGALIPPIANTDLPVVPTATKMYIDDVHWAQTAINSTQVTSLYNAMPYKVEIDWLADPALSTLNVFVEPTFGTGSGNIANVLAANAEFVNPVVSADYELIYAASPATASALAVEPFSVIADNITNKIVLAETMFATVDFPEPQGVVISFAGPTMYATARMASSEPYIDPYNLLIIKQSTMPIGTTYGGRWSTGDVDS